MKRVVGFSLALIAGFAVYAALSPQGPIAAFRTPLVDDPRAGMDAAGAQSEAPIADRGPTRLARAQRPPVEARGLPPGVDPKRAAWARSLTERASRGEIIRYDEERERYERGEEPLTPSEAAALAGGVAGGDASGTGPSSSPESGADAGRRSFGSAEVRAARVARENDLIPDDQLQHRVALAVPANSVPPEFLEEARERAATRLLAEEAVLDMLAKRQEGEGVPATRLRDVRDIGSTYLRTLGPSKLVGMMKEAADQHDAPQGGNLELN